jgi:hypothetical protein
MYIHLGQDTVVREDEIVGIFDMDNTTESKWTRKMLQKAQEEGKVVSIGDDIPKSFVLVQNKEGYRIYLSQLNTATLKQRAGTLVPEG